VQESTVETEVRAAHNVLEACAQTDAMERVVFTSSVTAVVWSGAGAGAHREEVADERSWSDLAFCRKFKVRTSERSRCFFFKFRFMDY
jgi:nucleoside-diphosphate-sugar epimerase